VSTEFATPLARPLVLQGKRSFRDFQIVKNTSNLWHTPIFSSEKYEKRSISNSK